MKKNIILRGARTHNLADIDLDIPRDQLVVITGLSGSGKSSLAFDTIYAEGQRRYVESLSAYARQFLSIMEKPDVDHIEGLSPAISIEQRSVSHNPRSTVGTITEIYDYLRLLYARVGEPHCPVHDIKLEAQIVGHMVEQVLSYEEGTRWALLAPIVEGQKGEHLPVFERLRSEGFIRARINGKMTDLDNAPDLGRYKKHTIEAVVDRFKVSAGIQQRLVESFETALRLSGGTAKVLSLDGDKESEDTVLFSSLFACHHCGYSLTELEPKLFSFNSPSGSCERCDGLGTIHFFDPELIVQSPELSLAGGAIHGWDRRNAYYYQILNSLAAHYGFDIDVPYKRLSKKIKQIILYGSGREEITFTYFDRNSCKVLRRNPFEGVVENFSRRYHERDSVYPNTDLSRYQTIKPCPRCKGGRLNEAARHVFIEKMSLPQISTLTVLGAIYFFEALKLSGSRQEIASKIVKEVVGRLRFLMNVGLGYLSLDRGTSSLSGGEAQRIRLAGQIGAGLVGVMYVLDEPSIGLHQRDNQRLLSTLFELRDLGNTVIVVEHDEETIRAADYVIDIGPGAGVHGGKVVAAGKPKEIIKSTASLTGRYLSGLEKIEVPECRKTFDRELVLRGACGNNLKSVELHLPIGILVCVTGVSGSGKSTLVNDTLYKICARELNHSGVESAPHGKITGLKYFDKVINIDQSPIGRTPRSNLATYTGLLTPVRELYAAIPEARARGYKPGRFSFNVKGGRCEPCQGDGLIKVEMHFLPDMYVPCDMCKGKRYNDQTLEIQYKGLNISELLALTVEEAARFFAAVPVLKNKLDLLMDVGLSYICLGQNAMTLSGGEAQRIKLSKELSKRDTGKTLYILDEPTTGLHFHDIKKLLEVLRRLRDKGNTVVVIEHNLDVIKTMDWIIDLGPEGGDAGGEIIATGTPEQVAKIKKSYTGQFIKGLLN